MKGAVHKDSSHTLRELKEGIANFNRNIPRVVLSRVVATKIRIVNAYLQAGGAHFQHLL
jgi:hypothetical protein